MRLMDEESAFNRFLSSTDETIQAEILEDRTDLLAVQSKLRSGQQISELDVKAIVTHAIQMNLFFEALFKRVQDLSARVRDPI